MEDIKILIVEDESIIAMDIQNLLRRLGYAKTFVAFSGQEAIEKFIEVRPDLVLMDIKLIGDMDGIETAERIRFRYHTPIIYISALSDNETLKRAEQTEPLSFIFKPVKERELKVAIKKAISILKSKRK